MLLKIVKKYLLPLSLIVLLGGCGPSVKELNKTGFFMEAVFKANLKVLSDDSVVDKYQRRLDSGFEELVRIDTATNLLSPISEVASLNSNGATRRVNVSSHLRSLLEKAVRGSGFAEGYFDITWYSMADFLRQNPRASRANLEQAKQGLGVFNINIDARVNRVGFSNRYTKVDVRRIRRGYAIDDLFERLRVNSDEVSSVKLEAGNVFYYYGKHNVELFKNSKYSFKLPLVDKGLARVQGVEDWLIGMRQIANHLPVDISLENIIEIVVIAPNATTAEVLANGFYFMGVEKTKERIVEIKDQVSDPRAYDVFVLWETPEGLQLFSSKDI